MKRISGKLIIALCCAVLVGIAIGFAIKGSMEKRELASQSQDLPVHSLTDKRHLLGDNELLAPDLWRISLDPIWSPAVFPIADATPLPTLLNFPDNMPKVQTKVGDKDVTVQVQVPGLTMNDVDVQVGKDMVAIKGQKQEKNGKDHNVKTIVESFEQVVSLPCAVDGNNTKATIKDGVLTVLMPKAKNNVAQHSSGNWQ